MGIILQSSYLLRDPELEDGVLSKLLNPVFRTGVELLVTKAALLALSASPALVELVV